jgi:hypothetical protein
LAKKGESGDLSNKLKGFLPERQFHPFPGPVEIRHHRKGRSLGILEKERRSARGYYAAVDFRNLQNRVGGGVNLDQIAFVTKRSKELAEIGEGRHGGSRLMEGMGRVIPLELRPGTDRLNGIVWRTYDGTA